MEKINKIVFILLLRSNGLKFVMMGFLSFLLTVGVASYGSSCPGNKECPAKLTLGSPAFSDGCPIPTKYARFDAHPAGENFSPPLTWGNVPAGTKSMVLICLDPDGGNWTHWVIFNIPPAPNQLPENVPKTPLLPDNSKQGRNSWNLIGYDGPSPPMGTGIHHYYFKIYALDALLDLSAGSTRDQVEAAMKHHILIQGQLLGTYKYK